MRNHRLATTILLSFLSLSVLAQSGPPAEVRAAREKLQAKDYDGAIAILEEFTKRVPGRGPALLLLAGAYEQKGDPAKAVATYEAIAKLPAFRGQGLFNLGAVHAANGDNAKAFEYLQMVKASGSFDMDVLRNEPRLQSLRKDPRFESLFPSPKDFLDPFVEKAKVLHEWRGESKGSQFGWIARRAGDVDGDHITDVVTSAPTFSMKEQTAGRIYLYSGKSGKLLWQVTGTGSEQLGTGIEAAGDTNHDGIPDVVAGAPGSGHAYVYDGRTGKLLLTVGAGDPNDSEGRQTSMAGDVNGDGYGDIVAGAPGHSSKAASAGRVRVFSGKDGAVLLTLNGERENDAFGSTVAGWSKGKKAIFMVGAPGGGPHQTGRVYVYEGMSAKPSHVFDSDETGGAFGGMFLSIVGDTNGDHTPDYYVSDWANRAKGPSTGRIYVYSGKDGTLLFTLTGEQAGDGFGIGVADAGDLDRDGADDLVIGAWQHASAAPSGGRVYLYSGKTQKLLRTITCRTAGDTFGFDATNTGDVDGDGTNDLLLTSAWSNVKGFQSGRMFLISGKSK